MTQLRNTFQTKKLDKTPEEQLSNVETGNLPGKEFRVIRVKMTQDLNKRVVAQTEAQECLTKNQKLEKTSRDLGEVARRHRRSVQKKLLMTRITKTVLSLSKSQTSWSVNLSGP